MRTKPLPSTDRLRELFRYRGGHLVRRVDAGPAKAGESTATRKPNTRSGYVQIGVDGELYYLHRIVWQWHGKCCIDGLQVDHRNGVRHDCKIGNLRVATQVENSQNRKTKRSGLTSKYVGVCWSEKGHAWVAQIKPPGSGVRCVGRFKTEEQAYRARVAAEKEHHAEFSAHIGRRLQHG